MAKEKRNKPKLELVLPPLGEPIFDVNEEDLEEVDNLDLYSGEVGAELLDEPEPFVIASEQEPLPAEPEPVAANVTQFREEFRNQPYIADQMVRFPGSYKLNSTIARVFDLGKEDSCQEYNLLMTKTIPQDAPIIMIECDQPVFSEKDSSFKTLVKYREVLYKKPSTLP